MNKEQYLQKISSELSENIKKQRRIFINIDKESFINLFKINAKNEMIKRNIDKDFIIDKDNAEVIDNLYYYLIQNNEFKAYKNNKKIDGDFNKGILLSGEIGTGKTIIISSFCNIIEGLSDKIIEKYHSKQLIKRLNDEQDDEYFNERPLFIDDIGKEAKEIIDYGTRKYPMTDLFSTRYNYGAWTFGTTNYTEKTLESYYGESITDRFNEIFNLLILKGKSRRI